ncbi:MAG: hypothetical protein ACKV2Q_07135 [Planctomycetaceae bacterium]
MRAELKDPQLLPSIVSLAKRKEHTQSFGFRRCLVDAVAQVPDKASVQFLIETSSKFDGQLRFETVQHLARLTGQNFGGHSDQWAAWWQDHSGTFQIAAARATTAIAPESRAVSRIPWPEPLPEFFGLPVYAKRVVFVIDRSRSMASSVDGVTRLEEAVKQLEKAVDALDRYAYFNVFAYHSDVLPFMTQLVQAEDSNKRASRNFALRLTPDKTTAGYDRLFAIAKRVQSASPKVSLEEQQRLVQWMGQLAGALDKLAESPKAIETVRKNEVRLRDLIAEPLQPSYDEGRHEASDAAMLIEVELDEAKQQQQSKNEQDRTEKQGKIAADAEAAKNHDSQCLVGFGATITDDRDLGLLLRARSNQRVPSPFPRRRMSDRSMLAVPLRPS